MKRILILKLWALGDLLMAAPLLTALHVKYPGIEITWGADTQYAGILEGHPLISDLVPVDTGTWRRLLRRDNAGAWLRESHRLNAAMRRRRFDAVINCHPDLWWTRVLCPAPMRVALYPTPHLPPTRFPYTHPTARPIARPNALVVHNTDYYLHALTALGMSPPFDRRMTLPISVDDERLAQAFLQSEREYRNTLPLVILHPGTSQSSKCWPVEQFAAVAAAL
jgi:ADP-heptose:LPS heptosyltransferase